MSKNVVKVKKNYKYTKAICLNTIIYYMRERVQFMRSDCELIRFTWIINFTCFK